MRVAYIRVSSIDQNEQRQIEEMKKFGAERIFIEKQSGATITHRPVFQEALDYVRDQDIFISIITDIFFSFFKKYLLNFL